MVSRMTSIPLPIDIPDFRSTSSIVPDTATARGGKRIGQHAGRYGEDQGRPDAMDGAEGDHQRFRPCEGAHRGCEPEECDARQQGPSTAEDVADTARGDHEGTKRQHVEADHAAGLWPYRPGGPPSAAAPGLSQSGRSGRRTAPSPPPPGSTRSARCFSAKSRADDTSRNGRYRRSMNS